MTIARWVAGGVRTLLCFDPTRGIDIGTKQPDLRAAARARGGRRGGPALHLGAQGDPARLRPGDRHLRRPGRRRDRRSRTPTSRPSSAPPTTCRRTPRCPRRSPRPSSAGRARRRPATSSDRVTRGRGRPATRSAAPGRTLVAAWARRNAWTLGAARLSSPACSCSRSSSSRATAPPQIQGLAIGVLPLALAAVAQAIVVISGGIDLSVGSMMALTSVTAAVLMKGQARRSRSSSSSASWCSGLAPGRDQRRRWSSSPASPTSSSPSRCRSSGPARRSSSCTRPAAARPTGSRSLVNGSARQRVGPARVPRARRHRRRDLDPAAPLACWACRMYAHRQQPAGRVPERRRRSAGPRSSPTRSPACSAALGGLALTATTGIGIAGARAVHALERRRDRARRRQPRRRPRRHRRADRRRRSSSQLVRTDLTLLGVNPNLATVIQGVILIGVVMFGSLLTMRRSAAMTRRRRHGPGAAAPSPATLAAPVPRPAAHPADGAARRAGRRPASSSSPGIVEPELGRRRRSAPRSRWRSSAGCQTLTMLTGGIDLSVGDGRLDGGVHHGDPGAAARARPSRSSSASAAAVIAGLVNGIGVGVFKVHPLIMTLGIGLVVLGLHDRLPAGDRHARASSCPTSIEWLGSGPTLGVPAEQPAGVRPGRRR